MLEYLKEHVLGSVIVAILVSIISMMIYFNSSLQTQGTDIAVMKEGISHIEEDVRDIKNYIQDNNALVEVENGND